MRFRIPLALALVLGLPLPSAAEEPTKGLSDPFATLYKEAVRDEELAPYRRSIEEAIEASVQISTHATKINAATKAASDKKRVQKLREQLTEKFPGAFVLLESTPVETDPNKIRARLSEVLENLRQSSVERCFNPEKRSFSGSTPCRDKLKLSCLELGSDGKGNLIATVVDENLGTKDVQFDSLEGLKKTYDYAFIGGTPAFCKLASLAGESFKATYPAAYPLSPKGAGFAFVFADPESIRTECFAIDIEAARKAISRIEERFPATTTGISIPMWKKNLDAREKRCSESVRDLCRNTYLLSGRAILAYPTKGCKVREVTAEDVDNDVKEMAEVGLTQADQLKHAQLKETIKCCQTADSRGFAWRFVEPSVAGCKPEKK